MRILKGLAWAVCGVVMALVMAFAWGRLRGPSERQATALKFFAQDMRPTKGRNAFPAMWLGDYDIPPDQIDTVYEQDRAHVRAWQVKLLKDGGVPPEFVSIAAGRFRKLTDLSEAESELTCDWQNNDCVGGVRSHRDQVAEIIARHATRLDHDNSYMTSDFSWNDLPTGIFGPFRRPGRNSLGLTSAALDFVDGKTTSALQKVCGTVVAIRRVHRHSNTLGETMFATRLLANAGRVFTQMLSELPLDQPLPENCGQAFAPVDTSDVDLGASMQNEFRSGLVNAQQGREYAGNLPMDWVQVLAVSAIGMQRQQAAQFAWMCSDKVDKQLLDDHSFGMEDFPSQADAFDWLSNPAGSILVLIPQPSYPDYLNRQADAVATLRLVATILWLRQTHVSEKPLTVRLQQRPAWMLMAMDRHFGLSKDGGRLHMDYHQPQKVGADVTEWPLPAGL